MCKVTDPWRYSSDSPSHSPQGSLEVPCRLVFHGTITVFQLHTSLLQPFLRGISINSTSCDLL